MGREPTTMTIQKTKTSVSILNPQEEFLMVMAIIEKFKTINNLNFNLEIVEDFHIPELGCVYPFNQPNNKKQPYSYKLYVNPNNCETSTDDSSHALGFIQDLSMFGVALHEFSHLICFNIYPDLIKQYETIFAVDRLVLNEYSNVGGSDEEIAEIIVLYLTNPYMLKLVSKKHYLFLKKYMKSPVPDTKKRCYIIYNSFPFKCKELLKSKFGIMWDINKKDFVKIEKK